MKFSKRNITALKRIIVRYRKVTLEQIKKETAKRTYFNSIELKDYFISDKYERCIACKSVDSCFGCFWGMIANDWYAPCVDHKTYESIIDAETPRQLLTAFRKRADYIEKQLKKYNL